MTDLRKAAKEAAKVLANALSIDFNDKRDWYSYKHDVEYVANLLRQALAQNPLDIADRAYFAGKKAGVAETLAQPEQNCYGDGNVYRGLRSKDSKVKTIHVGLTTPPNKPEQEPDYGTDRGAWSDVPDATKWVDELRGDEEFEQEPVAYVGEVSEGAELMLDKPNGWEAIPLYTAPPSKPWVSLTDDEMGELYDKTIIADIKDYAKAIESKLKEKNNG